MHCEPTARQLRFPVSVLMERRLARVGRWQQYQWECVAVVAGEDVVDRDDAGCTLVSDDGDRARFMFSGLELGLFKDGCESYWYNLQSEAPYLFVVCFHDEDTDDEAMAVDPVFVTPSQDEANAHMESEDLVFSVPMPDKVLEWVERYVVDHYEPEIKKKRKRRNWAAENDAIAKARTIRSRVH